MRKVLSIVLVLALVLGSTAFTFGALPSDVKGTKYEDAVNVLMELDVISGYPDGSYKPAGIVTRGEMAKIIICALGLEDYAAGASSFKDMAGHWSDKYVAYAVSLGIINGYPDGTFKPDNTVTYDEAAKMLVAALGYTEAALVGTWPANWVTKAKSLGILDGVKAGSVGANRGDIALMAFQTLPNALGKVDHNGVWQPNVIDPTTVPPTYETLLDRLGAELYTPASGVAGGAFIVTDALADAAVANIREYIGAYVTAYANDGDIIAIKEVKSVFITGDLNAAGDEFEASDKTYDVVGGQYFATNRDIVTNGVSGTKALVGAGTWAAEKPAAGEYTIAADVSGNKIKNVYSIGSWTIDADFQFSDGDLDDDSIGGNDFRLDDNDDIDMNSFALMGVNSLEDIKEDNVVYVYNNKYGVAKIEVGTEVVTGEVTKVNADATKITVGGTAYAMWDGSAFSADIEDEVKLFLDYAGDVYEVDTVESTGGNYAVILQVENATLGLSGKDASVKLFLEDGTTKTFKVDEDFTDANKSLLTAKGTWNSTTFDTSTTNNDGKYRVTTPVVVEYSVDKDGVVDFIDEVAYHADSPGTAAEELTEKGYYEGKAVAKDAVMFTYEGSSAADASDADKYGITTVAKATEKKFAAEYVVDKGKIIVMLTSGLGSGDEDIYGVVTGRAKTSESSSDYQVTMLIDGKEEKYDITKTVYDLFTTDTGNYNYDTIYKLTINTKDQISGLAAATGPEIVLGSWTAASAYSNGVLTAGTDYTIDSDAVAYKWNATDGIFGPSNPSKSNMVAAEVKLYDTDDDGVADLVLIRKDAVAPTVLTKIAAINAGVGANATYTLKFSEVLDAASKSAVKAAVEAAFTTGGTSTIEFTWNADGVTLDGTFTYGDTNLVIAAVAGLTVKDLAGNSAALVTGDLQN